MDDFLGKFFPKVLRDRHNKDNYCQYNNQGLQAFTSSLYIAGMFSALAASYSTRLLGRTRTMLFAGISIFIGAVLNAAAENLEMLIFGRILLGFGVGFGNQVCCYQLYPESNFTSTRCGKRVCLCLLRQAPCFCQTFQNTTTTGAAVRQTTA